MVDYSNEGFTLPIERDGVRGYASINSILAREEDGLEVTGNYYIYLLHPVLGSTNFTLERSGDESDPWEISTKSIWELEEDIVQEIIEAIELRRMKQELNITE